MIPLSLSTSTSVEYCNHNITSSRFAFLDTRAFVRFASFFSLFALSFDFFLLLSLHSPFILRSPWPRIITHFSSLRHFQLNLHSPSFAFAAHETNQVLSAASAATTATAATLNSLEELSEITSREEIVMFDNYDITAEILSIRQIFNVF